MTSAEALVLVAAALLALAVIAGRGTLSPRVGVLLLTLAMMAVLATLLHMATQ